MGWWLGLKYKHKNKTYWQYGGRLNSMQGFLTQLITFPEAPPFHFLKGKKRDHKKRDYKMRLLKGEQVRVDYPDECVIVALKIVEVFSICTCAFIHSAPMSISTSFYDKKLTSC